MTQHAMGQNPLIYTGLAAIFTAVIIFMIFYTRRMSRLGRKNETPTENTQSEIVRELRADGTKIDDTVRPKGR